METKYPHCNCLHSECKASKTPYDCPKCTWKQCDCWEENNRLN